MVHTQAVVGEITDDTAVLTSETLQLFRMPLALLPHPLTVGTVVDLHAAVNPAARAEREAGAPNSSRHCQHSDPSAATNPASSQH